MLPRSTRSLGFLALAALIGCTVEGSRQAGDSCLMSRECAAPLRCELTAEGVSRCVPPVRLDLPAPDASAPPPDVAAPPDAPPPDVAPPMDQAPPPDAPAPMDAPREMPAPADVPREPSAPDAADEPRADAVADLPDDLDDDRPREAATD